MGQMLFSDIVISLIFRVHNDIQSVQVEQPSVPLVHNKNGVDDANPATDDLAAKTCDKIMINADSDENSKLITIELTKV